MQFINGYVIDICGPREALLGVANKITGTPQGMRIVTTAVVVEAESLVLVTDTIISVEEHLTGWLFHELCSECAKDDSNVRLDRGRIA